MVFSNPLSFSFAIPDISGKHNEHSFQKIDLLHDIDILDCYFHIVFKSGANVRKKIESPNISARK